MSFDPMAAVIDWLDAYRSGVLEDTLALYADDATVECGCGGTTLITGRHALRAYWEQRLSSHPASELKDLRPVLDATAITYVCNGKPVRAAFEFNADGEIVHQRCGPSSAQSF